MTLVTGECTPGANHHLRMAVDDMLSELEITTRVGPPHHHFFDANANRYVYKTYRLFGDGVFEVAETEFPEHGGPFQGYADEAIAAFAQGLGTLLENGLPLVWRSQPEIHIVRNLLGSHYVGLTARCRCIQVPTVPIADTAAEYSLWRQSLPVRAPESVVDASQP